MKQTHAIAAVLVAGLFVGSNALAAATASFVARDTLVAKRPRDLVPSDLAPSDEVPEIEIDRDGDALSEEIRPRPTDTDIADTALVFTNQTRHRVEVRCLARNDDGETIGRARIVVPGGGLRYLRASDLSEGADFVGSALCKSAARVVATAMLFGVEISDLPSRSVQWGKVHRFPLIATY